MTTLSFEDKHAALTMIGYFIDGDERELIQIEYRYIPDEGCELYTCIQDQVYEFREYRFFSVVSALLDQLPPHCAIMIPHQIVVSYRDSKEIATLEEWWYPYDERDSDTVLYQLKITIRGILAESQRHVSSFGGAIEEIHKQIGNDVHLKVCWFCKFFLEYNYFGGTDDRHDQLFCFRDNPELVDQIRTTASKRHRQEHLWQKGMQGINALHSCSAFAYAESRKHNW